MHHSEFTVGFTQVLDAQMQRFLIRRDGDEDLMFALWTPSHGSRRFGALLHTALFPERGDRQRHGNVSFNLRYLERACSRAMKSGSGVAFIHSHPRPGWQGMSEDDVVAETKMAGAVARLTDLPLLGLTVGTNGIWSARFWLHRKAKIFDRAWCQNVRSVGKDLRVSFADKLIPRPAFRELFKRTITVWGENNHANLARLRIGIIGLGSVGSIIAETLARMGCQRFTFIDYDEVQPHNLDRLLGATKSDVGKLKVIVAERQIRQSSTAAKIEVLTVPFSVVEEQGYRAALDCDVLFCCVDRPRPRQILNHIAYAHLIPVIDGGIQVRFKDGKNFSGVDWQLQTVSPSRPCLECLDVFSPADASTEAAGKLDDPSYLKGLPADHGFKRNENVFPFSANLASLEVLQLVALVTGIARNNDFGIQRYRYNPGILESDTERTCRPDCDAQQMIAQGDQHFHLYGQDHGAEAARARQRRFKKFRRWRLNS
jgi:molybdopterin/thiamine biosynthesis adenylyltransferase